MSLLPSPAFKILKVSLPVPPTKVSVPAPLLISNTPVAWDILMVPLFDLTDKIAVPEFDVPVVATKFIIFAAVAVAPLLTTRTSSSPPAPAPPRRVIMSEPESTFRVSLPPPPLRVSSPPPPVIISLPEPPVILSA